MKLFSRVTFLCNCSFLLFIILRFVESSSKGEKGNDNLVQLPFVTGTLVILGQLSIVISFIFCLVVGIMFLMKRVPQVPRWLLIVNLLFFLVQVFFFFIY
ncbi:MAG: hypothetical protein V4725_00315 [Bacteroidota bacterium]